MQGGEDQRLALRFPLPMEGLGDLDDRGGDAEGRPTPTGGHRHWQDLTSVTTQRADVRVFSVLALRTSHLHTPGCTEGV